MKQLPIDKVRISQRCSLYLAVACLSSGSIASFFSGATAAEAEGPALVFSSNRSGNFEILLMNVGTSGVKNLTNHEAEDSSPTWSPDGKRIAFQSERSGNLDVYVMDADGSHVKQLTSDPNPDRMPAWSPDGKKIAFCRHVNGRNPEIFVMDADGSNQINLTNDSGFDADPAWSPDGAKILFGAARKGSGGFRLFVMNADGTNVQMLPAKSRGSPYVHPAWSPNGKQLAYTESVEGGGLEIFVCDPDGSNERKLTSLGGLTTFAAWSPDGKKIAFQHHAKFDQPGTLYVMDADGSNQQQIVSGEAQSGQATLGGGRPAWKPKDGETKAEARVKGVPPRDPSTKKSLIDLSDHLNGSLREGWLPSSSFGTTAEKAIPIPLGVGKFGDVDFDVRGVVQLSGQRMKKEGGEFPESAQNIRIGMKCQRLYFLHASAWASMVDKGTQIGVFLVRYADGTERGIPLATGRDIGGWAEQSDEDYPNASRVWKGTSPGGSRASIFKSEWRNPLPELEIKSIDYISKMTEAAPFLIAITVE